MNTDAYVSVRELFAPAANVPAILLRDREQGFMLLEDLGTITGETGLMTHMLPRAMRAVEPWLRQHVTDARFWDGAFDQTHTGEIELPTPTDADRKAMFERYAAQPNPLAGKRVVAVSV